MMVSIAAALTSEFSDKSYAVSSVLAAVSMVAGGGIEILGNVNVTACSRNQLGSVVQTTLALYRK